MTTSQTAFLILAFVCFVLAAFKAYVIHDVKVDTFPLGFAFIVLVFLFS